MREIVHFQGLFLFSCCDALLTLPALCSSPSSLPFFLFSRLHDTLSFICFLLLSRNHMLIYFLHTLLYTGGQAGNQIGAKFWEVIADEHGKFHLSKY